MNRMNFGRRSGVIIDVCKTHGTWFDEGEYARVLAFVRSHGLEADLAPSQAHALTSEAAQTVRHAEALMQYEAVSEQQSIAHAVDVAEDLVWLLFG